MVWHVVEHNVLNHVSICEVGDNAERDDHQANCDMGPDCVQEHLPWLTMLRVDVQDAGIAFENRENFAEEQREVSLIEIFEVVRTCLLSSGSNLHIAELVG